MITTLIRSLGLTMFLMLSGAALSAVTASAATYYMDSVSGNDANAGTEANTAWKSLAKINALTAQPGDKILLKRGGSWTGTLSPKGSGTASAPIVMDNYGTGNLPLINGNGNEATVYLYNQQYWDINNLEITNSNGTSSRRNGIYVVNEDAGTLKHIHLVGNNIHDVAGNNVKDGNGSSGIKVRTIAGKVKSNYQDILIDGNTVGPRVDRTGIDINTDYWCRPDSGCGGTNNWYPSSNVMISNNYVTDVGGDGIVPMGTQGAVVQYNTVNGFNMRSGSPNAGIWAWNADNTVIQYNESFNGHSTQDGQGFDVDYGQTGTLVQYNYSHDNDGGFILICQSGSAKNDSGIVRYNISQNDKARVFQLAGPTTNTQVYNNTIYLPQGSTTSPIYVNSWDGYTKSISFMNNIWMLQGAGNWQDLSKIGNFTFNYNTIAGVHSSGEPADANKLTSNPLLADAGSGQSRNAVDGYKLVSGSSSIGSGAVIANNGGKDYYGNGVSSTSTPNRGAYNGAGVSGPANLMINGGFEQATLTPWSNWNTASVVSGSSNSGGYAVQLSGGPGSAEQLVYLEPNSTYTFTGYVKTADVSQPVRMGVKNYGGAEQYSVVSNSSYTKATITFTTGSSNSTAVVYIYKPSGSAKGYGDDFTITKN
ncbi:hypothetical protein J2Z69_001089 [Paenibacillus shirakamiensis]|uniref:CBM-cenC domain-containing protein n=1 Tax=Paenibacillus shirakamiensis TaxID=1265935 RepID=A0ABS4JEG1_9BACL|nr:carbohydrate binding domain-containing protein [Paenibacillus shirakamiensis]MBP2000070.1 hypothetical protein [Paenibacillus shirakamiensis]